jgi:hypothetical protein
MSAPQRQIAAPCALVVGAVLGVAGTFASSASVRGLLWSIDGVALVLAGALLTIYHVNRGNSLVAAGFLAFLAGQTLILATAAAPVDSSGPIFGPGVALWATSLVVVSVPSVMPLWVRVSALGGDDVWLGVDALSRCRLTNRCRRTKAICHASCIRKSHASLL